MPVPRNTDTSHIARSLDFESCMACGQVCEITGCFEMPGLEGPERYVRTRCVGGHMLVGPEFALRAPAA